MVKVSCLGVVALLAMTPVGMANANISAGLGYDNTVSASIEVDDVVNLSVSTDAFSFDYHFMQGELQGTYLHIVNYVGAGVFYDVSSENEEEYGIRMPMGFDIQFAKQAKGYIQIHPELYISDESDNLELGLGWSMGVRYVF